MTTTAQLVTAQFALNLVGCGDCYWKIESELKELRGVRSVTYLGKDVFEAVFDRNQTNKAVIIKRIEDLGFRMKGKKYETVGVLEGLRLAFRRARSASATKKVGMR